MHQARLEQLVPLAHVALQVLLVNLVKEESREPQELMDHQV